MFSGKMDLHDLDYLSGRSGSCSCCSSGWRGQDLGKLERVTTSHNESQPRKQDTEAVFHVVSNIRILKLAFKDFDIWTYLNLNYV